MVPRCDRHLSPCRSLQFSPSGPSLLVFGLVPDFYVPTFNHLPRYPFPATLSSALLRQGSVSLSLGPMALQALQSSGVAFRKILSHFPEELSLAFAYGSGVYRQAGPSSNQKVSPAWGQPHAENRPVFTSSLLPTISPEPYS